MPPPSQRKDDCFSAPLLFLTLFDVVALGSFSTPFPLHFVIRVSADSLQGISEYP